MLACAEVFEAMRESDGMIEVPSRVLAIAVPFTMCLQLTGSACRPGLQSFQRHQSWEYQHQQSATSTWTVATYSEILLDAFERCIIKCRATKRGHVRVVALAEQLQKRHSFLAIGLVPSLSTTPSRSNNPQVLRTSGELQWRCTTLDHY